VLQIVHSGLVQSSFLAFFSNNWDQNQSIVTNLNHNWDWTVADWSVVVIQPVFDWFWAVLNESSDDRSSPVLILVITNFMTIYYVFTEGVYAI
jgi:hypothetical protein